MSITEHMHVSNESIEPARRIEVFTGAGRRRSWSVEDKARIIAESYSGIETVSAVARRHGLTAQQLFGWRRTAERSAKSNVVASPGFVPALLEAPAAEPERKRRTRQVARVAPTIELEIGGVTVLVGRDAEAKTVAAIVRALKADS
jgi:transposase